MTGGLAAFAGGGGDGTAAEIAQISDLAKQFCLLLFQLGQ
jgi:hypothetical protein